MFIIFDIESDGLLEEATIIHCLSYQVIDKNFNKLSKGSITSYDDIINFFKQDAVFIGHSITDYDFPLVKKILDIDNEHSIIDTLKLSWYLYPIKDFRHGLKFWGERLGLLKPEVEDWVNLSIEQYIYRCESDVEINTSLFLLLVEYASNIYEDFESMFRAFGYIQFKARVLQQQSKIPLDVSKATKHLKDLEKLFIEKTEHLSDSMPIELGKILKTIPKVLKKKDGSLSAHGQNWYTYLNEHNLPLCSNEVREKPNPSSTSQVKKWLFSLGWKPETFKTSKNTGEEVPQINLPFGKGLCPSIKSMFDDYPILKDLDNYYVIKSRMDVFKAYLKYNNNGYIYSKAHGFTNTLRLTHSNPIVNLPKVGTFYGKEVRECLSTPNSDYVMCGSDISSLEDSTKQHYIYFFDPKYVDEMRVEGFDPHLDIGVLSGLITEEEADHYKKGVHDSKYNDIKSIRFIAKTTNFSATYLAGAPKIAKTADISLEKATKLHTIYWQRNWAIKEASKQFIIKTVRNPLNNRNEKWVLNPVSKIWMYLKKEKDVFSTINQSTGVYVFDTWLRYCLKYLKYIHVPVLMQYHDELMLICHKSLKDIVNQILRKAINEANETLQLNVPIDISIDWGSNYADVH